MKALIIGATGATGKDLVDVLLNDPDYKQIVIFVRHTSGLSLVKLTEILTDFDALEQQSQSINGDVWFSCIGTTLKMARSKEKQKHIDYEIPLQFAQIAKKNGVSKAVLLSSYGASADSNIFYSKIKGQLEGEIEKLSFEALSIFRPAMLQRKNTDRPAERIVNVALQFVNRLGILRKFRPMPTLVLAQKLAKAPKVFGNGTHVVALDEIFRF